MAKRGHNEGSIYQRKDGRWVAALGVKDGAGRTRKVYRYASTRTKARVALRDLERRVEEGVQLTAGAPTLGAYLTKWLGTVKATVRVSTHQGYSSILQVRVIPRIGKVKLTKVTPLHLQELYAELLDAGLTARSVGHTHRVLHRAFSQAVRWGLIGRNPCDGADPPRARPSEMRVLTREQAAAFLDATRDHRYHALYVLALSTGMRQGELLGLSWDAVDLDAGKLVVQRALQRQRVAGLVFVEPKTKRSRRTVLLSQRAIAALREQRARQLEARLKAGSEWRDQGLVFSNPTGGPLDPSEVTRVFQRLLAEKELPVIRFHDLRHTAATLLLTQGVHPKVVSEMLGHSTITLTLDTYSHLVPVLHQQAAAAMDALLGS